MAAFHITQIIYDENAMYMTDIFMKYSVWNIRGDITPYTVFFNFTGIFHFVISYDKTDAARAAFLVLLGLPQRRRNGDGYE